MSGSYQYARESGFGMTRLTWAVQRLLVANIAIFAVQLLLEIPFGDLRMHPVPGGRISEWLSFSPSGLLGGMLYLPITYQFLHYSLHHLFSNMLALFFFGPEVERMLGTRKFYIFYLFCGGVGVLATLLSYVLSGSDPLVVGASGAVMGVLIAFALIEPDREFFLFPIPIPINARILVAIFIIMNIVFSLDPGSNVSVATHFGGMGAGFAYMKLLPKINAWNRERRVKKKAASKGKKGGKDKDKLAEAIDNIFDFDDKKKH